MMLPSTVLAQPHCGDNASFASGTRRLASWIRRFNSSAGSSCPRLGRHQPQHYLHAAWHMAQRREIAATLVVVFEQEMVRLEATQHRFGNALIAAFGD